MNLHDGPMAPSGEAKVQYLDAGFRVLRPGAFVRCAVTGMPIRLDDLLYWSVARQEAYSSREAVLTRLTSRGQDPGSLIPR